MTNPTPPSASAENELEDKRIVEILEDFAENLASAHEEDSFARRNQVVTESVNEAKADIQALIALHTKEAVLKARLDTIERIKSHPQWGMTETCMDCAGSLAVSDEQKRLAELSAPQQSTSPDGDRKKDV